MTTITDPTRIQEPRRAELRPPDPTQTGWLGLSWGVWVIVGLVSTMMLALYWANLRRLWLKTNIIDGTAEWAHATLVPIIALYFVYLHLDELKAARIKPLIGTDFSRTRFVSAFGAIALGLVSWFVMPHVPQLGSMLGTEFELAGKAMIVLGLAALVMDWGLATLIGGLAISAYGIWPGQNDYVKDVGMVMSLFGVVLTLCGWAVMKIAYFPIVFLICALPWPGLFYSEIAMPLQEMAAGIGVGMLQVLGVDAVKEGTTIWLNFPAASGQEDKPITVAEACAGLKSLMTFITMGAAIAYLSNRPLWQKLLIIVSAVPIAIGCNVFRVAMMGYSAYHGRDEVLSGAIHGYAGLIFMILPGFILLLGFVWVLDKLVIEEADDGPAVIKRGGAA